MTVPKTFEFDDYPRDKDRLFPMLDALKQKCPDFKATLFAVPSLMTPAAWEPLSSRREWIEVGPHGFTHRRRECRTPDLYNVASPTLDEICADPRYARVYKSPWKGYDQAFLQRLYAIGMVPCFVCLPNDTPYPAPMNMGGWFLNDRLQQSRDDEWKHYEFHPVATHPKEFKMAATSLTDAAFARYAASIKPDDRFAFVRELTEPLSIRLNLGCGNQIWPGWQSFDRREIEGAVNWQFPQRLPYMPCRCDVAFTSHVFEYLDESEYADFALEVWRVLRPCAVWRITDIQTTATYHWRPIGSVRTGGTGQIKSLPTKEKICDALWNVGFHVYESRPGETLSPCKDVLQGDNRLRLWRQGHKFYIEAVKALSMRDLKRWRWYDAHATRDGTYLHIKTPDVPATFFINSTVRGNRRIANWRL